MPNPSAAPGRHTTPPRVPPAVAHTRKRAGATVLGLIAIAAIAFVPATPAQAEPSIKDVKARVDRLYHEAEAAQERLHDARIDLADLRKDLAGLKADQDSLATSVSTRCATRSPTRSCASSRARASRRSARSSSPTTPVPSSTRSPPCRRSTICSRRCSPTTTRSSRPWRSVARPPIPHQADRRAHRAAQHREVHGRREARRGQERPV